MKIELDQEIGERENKYVSRFKAMVESLPLDFNLEPGELNYTDPISILADATLSMNRPYKKFVVPRIELIRKHGLRNLNELRLAIETLGVEGFRDFWNYNHPERVIILDNLADKFLRLKIDYGLEDDMDTLFKWGKESRPPQWKDFGIPGIGFTTFQYLRILCGGDTVKPDLHIKRAVEGALGKRLPSEQIVELVEKCAQNMAIPARRLDYALWSYYSGKKIGH